MKRYLDEFDIFVRFNTGVSIIEKVLTKNYPLMSEYVSSVNPFGLHTFIRPSGEGDLLLYANKDRGNIKRSTITKGQEFINKWKILISAAYGEGGENRRYPRTIIGKPIVAPPSSACTATYLVVDSFDTEIEAKNLATFLRSKFARFLIGLRKNTQHISKDRFLFVPQLPMDREWTDAVLYEHFGLSDEEIDFIESMIRPMLDK